METLGVGTLTEIAERLPFKSGKISSIAFVAPVLVGIIDSPPALALLISEWGESIIL